ncbi:MAG: ABC transporter substrate-binding protein, partial [Peptoniphilus lacydonensis]|nr:ABC transporter substrate-binding protein [Peptoniphilus lacydonensis]
MKKRIIVVMALMIALFMTGCSNKEEKEGEAPVLKVAVAEDATTLETNSINDDYAENIIIQVYDTLV